MVSVIVPVFNGERFLRESLDSILAQTYPRIEVIVMDDASTDGTPAVVASYGQRVKSHRQPSNRGIYGNANDGIVMACGQYIAVYHADDVYDPQIVEREVEFLERHPRAGAVFCRDIFIDPDGRVVGELILPPEVRGGDPLGFPVVFNALLKYKNRFLRCPSSMVRAAAHRDVGVYRDAEYRNTSDVEMWLRIARKYPIGILDEPLYRYRFGHGNSAQRYHHLRTDPERYFRIMDEYLEQGARAEATPESLAAHEAHREEDRLLRAVSCYILGELARARAILSEVRARRILASPMVQRGRLLALLAALRALARMPRIPVVADAFRWRWHGRGRSRKERLRFEASSPQQPRKAAAHSASQ